MTTTTTTNTEAWQGPDGQIETERKLAIETESRG